MQQQEVAFKRSKPLTLMNGADSADVQVQLLNVREVNFLVPSLTTAEPTVPDHILRSSTSTVARGLLASYLNDRDSDLGSASVLGL